jgi:hypothetical protein
MTAVALLSSNYGSFIYNNTIQPAVNNVLTVALSGDGLTMASGDFSTGGTSIGQVTIFVRSNLSSNWSIQTTIVGTGYTGTPGMGTSVALSANGNTLAFGGANNNSGEGATWVWTRSGTTWSQMSSMPLIVTGSTGSTQAQGNTVCLSDDGLTLAINAPSWYDGTYYIGAFIVFKLSGGTWSQMTGSPFLGSATPTNYCLRQIALSGNGLYGIVADWGFNGQRGALAFVYYNGTTWTYQSSWTTPSDGSGGQQTGRGLALNKDGNVCVIGGPANQTNTGYAWIYTRSGITWTQATSKFTDGSSLNYFGNKVSITSNGQLVAVSAANQTVTNTSVGTTYVYSFNQAATYNGITKVSTLVPPVTTTNTLAGYWGMALAPSSGSLVVTSGPRQAVYTYNN